MPLPGNPPLVTVFGGGGFIGRYVCEALVKAGVRLRIAERQPRNAYSLQPLGQVGQIALVRAHLARPATIERAVEGAAAVINLVGVFKGDLQALHVDGAGKAAAAARDGGASAFVHISAIGADTASASNYGRTKELGERAVRNAFANATIVRPSVVFGAEDEFTNRFATMARLPVTPVIAPNVRFQPVFARDLGEAIAAMAGLSPSFVEVPDFVSGIVAKFGFLPGAPLSSDQWAMLAHDNVASDQASGLEAFGIVPTALSAVAPEWLGRFVKGGRFAARATA